VAQMGKANMISIGHWNRMALSPFALPYKAPARGASTAEVVAQDRGAMVPPLRQQYP